ncbi:MAG: DUF2357 domain-containing protein, partial [Rhodothermales bacterium]|nr:DUF2357 domain-containing protein [Rhodothermales bacterium]
MSTLFTIETPAVRLVWSRRGTPSSVAAPGGAPERPFGLVVEPLAADPMVYLSDEVAAHLSEQTDYALLVRSRTGAPVALRHRDPVLLHGLMDAEQSRLVHGTVNFGAQVGRSRFVVESGGVPQFAVTVEVAPSKLDYRQDYAALRDDVRAIAAELALEQLRPTTAAAGGQPPEPPGTVAWLARLAGVLDALERALTYAARHPLWDAERVAGPVAAHRVRRPDAALRRAVQRGAGWGPAEMLPGIAPVRAHVPAAASRYTLDTPAHRWIAARLRQIGHRLAGLREAEGRRRPGPRRRRVLAEIASMQRRIIALERLEIVQAAAGPPPPEPPLPLRTAPGYREAYRACLALQRGLHLGGGPLDLSLKDVHLLYEYWCFLTLVRLVAARTGERAPLRNLIRVEQRGLHLRLRQGRAQTLRFPLPDGALELVYNPRFGGHGFLVPQQPDVLLTHHTVSGPRRYVLDAKYRLDASPGYRRRYGVPGPPPD